MKVGITRRICKRLAQHMYDSFKPLAIAWGSTLFLLALGLGLLNLSYNPHPTAVEELVSDEKVSASNETIDTLPETAEPIAEETPKEAVFRPIPVEPVAALIEMTDRGPLPIKTRDGRQSFTEYAATPVEANGKAQIAIIVAEMGRKARQTRRALTDMPEHTTFAFSPYGQGNNGWAQQARRANHEVLVQIPMEPTDYAKNDPGPLALTTTQGTNTNLNFLRSMLGSVSGYVGVLTDMGSRFTAAGDSMRPVLSELRDRGLMYVDGMATRYSRGPTMAKALGVPASYHSREGFIDSELSAVMINERLNAIEAEALANGYAVGIIRPYPVSISAVNAWAAGMEERGFTLVPISQIANRQPSKS